MIGGQVLSDLTAMGHEVVPFDIIDGCDIHNAEQLKEVADGCDAIVHSAALLGNDNESPDDIFRINLVGTFNVLRAAATIGIKRVVSLSSVDVLGCFKGEAEPAYLPLDNDHPCNPSTAYGISKLLGEIMCETFSRTHDMTVISLRPPGVWREATYEFIASSREHDASFEYSPYWEYGAFIDVRDVSGAVLAALICEVVGAHAVLIASPDLSTSGPTSREWAHKLHPDVDWRGGETFDRYPFLSLVDSRPAQELLGWKPIHGWVDFSGVQ